MRWKIIDQGFKFILPFVAWVVTATTSNGQHLPEYLQKNIFVPADSMRFDSLIHLASKQSGIRFSLNTRKFDLSRNIRVKTGKQSISELLTEIKANTGISCLVMGDHIIFVDKPPAKPASAGPEKKPAGHPAFPGAAPRNKPGAEPVTATTGVGPGYSANAMSLKPLSLAGPVSILKPAHIDPHTPPLRPAHRPPVSDAQNTSGHGTSSRSGSVSGRALSAGPFVQAGLATDDLLYLGSVIRGGYPWLYGIFSWGTNFNVSGFQYGAGTSVRLADSWRLHLTYTRGSMFKDFKVDTLRESQQTQRVGIFFLKSLGDHLNIEFGPCFNDLATGYYKRNAASPLLISETDANSRFHLWKPLYTISDSYSSSSAKNTRVWIGFRISFFYRINL